jgi:CRP-like cAMP-binding protein
MVPLKALFHYFDQYLALDERERDELKNRIVERPIKRKYFILQEGDLCKHYTFVADGCVKMYRIDESGKEHNIQFAIENDWIVDIGSFHTETPSELYIEALEPSHLIQIEKSNLLYLYTHYPKFDRNFRVIIEQKYIELQNRILQTISSTADNRYESFLKKYPYLANRLPNTEIASYLGITPEFLSKIRGTRAKKS